MCIRDRLRDNLWCSSWAHWKAHSGLPISVNWTFLLDVMAEALRGNIDWKSAISLQRGRFDPRFQVEGVARHQLFFFSENYAKWYFVWYKNLDTCLFCFVTIHALTDRQTDRQTPCSSLVRAGIPCSAEKKRDDIMAAAQETAKIVNRFWFVWHCVL